MTLKEFVEKFVCKNTLIRLWTPNPNKHGHIMLCDKDVPVVKETCMEWELLRGLVYQSRYNNCKFIGVTDILCETYKEAVNLVIDIEHDASDSITDLDK